MFKIICCCVLMLVGGPVQALATATFTLAPSDELGNPFGPPIVAFADGLQEPVIPVAPPWIVPSPPGPTFGFDLAPSVAPGQVLDLYWVYSIALTVDGLDATRQRSGCIQWYSAPACPPAATGSEFAFAGVGVIGDTRASGGQRTSFISALEIPRVMTSGEAGNAESLTQTGVMHLQFTGTPSEISRPTSYSVFGWVWVDSNPMVSPIPEPATYLLMASGLILMAVRKQRARTVSTRSRVA